MRPYPGIPALARAKPAFVMAAIGQLQEELVQPDWRAFEWGSGASTLWLSQWCAHAVSVEHDPDWHRQTVAELAKYGIGNVELAWAGLGGAYESYIDRYPNGHFDLIFVDGRNRAACIGHAINHLKPGGVLVLDDSQREQYQTAIAARLGGWQRWDHVSGGGPAKMTTVWRKS